MIFAFTFALFVATYLLYTAGEHSERQLRAYVLISQGEISDIMSDQKIAVKLFVKNYGQTPAYKVAAWLRVDIAPFPLKTTLQPADVQQIDNTNIGPGGEQLMRLISDGPIPVELRAGFEPQKASAVYVHGIIKYVDAFEIRRTNFRLYKGGRSGVTGPELSFTTDDNEAN